MNIGEFIVTLINSEEINPEVVKVMGNKPHTKEELRQIINDTLYKPRKKSRKKIKWEFGFTNSSYEKRA